MGKKENHLVPSLETLDTFLFVSFSSLTQEKKNCTLIIKIVTIKHKLSSSENISGTVSLQLKNNKNSTVVTLFEPNVSKHEMSFFGTSNR